MAAHSNDTVDQNRLPVLGSCSSNVLSSSSSSGEVGNGENFCDFRLENIRDSELMNIVIASTCCDKILTLLVVRWVRTIRGGRQNANRQGWLPSPGTIEKTSVGWLDPG